MACRALNSPFDSWCRMESKLIEQELSPLSSVGADTSEELGGILRGTAHSGTYPLFDGSELVFVVRDRLSFSFLIDAAETTSLDLLDGWSEGIKPSTEIVVVACVLEFLNQRRHNRCRCVSVMCIVDSNLLVWDV